MANSCYTYFRIVGGFDPQEVTQLLGIRPFETSYGVWCAAKCEEYNVYVTHQMEKTIAPFLGKEAELNQIREKMRATFYLEVVPEAYEDEPTPCLAPSLKVMDFCHATRTELDIDLYIYGSED